jgi:hypothetical protein
MSSHTFLRWVAVKQNTAMDVIDYVCLERFGDRYKIGMTTHTMSNTYDDEILRASSKLVRSRNKNGCFHAVRRWQSLGVSLYWGKEEEHNLHRVSGHHHRQEHPLQHSALHGMHEIQNTAGKMRRAYQFTRRMRNVDDGG